MNRKLRRPVSDSSMTSEPRMSAGIRSGVNCTLLTEAEHDAQGLDQPGLGQARHPDQEHVTAASSAVSASSITCSCPKIARPISLRTRPKRSIVVSTSSRIAVSSCIDRSPIGPTGPQHMAMESRRANLTCMSMCHERPFGSTPGRASRPHQSAPARRRRGHALAGPADHVGWHVAVSRFSDRAHRAGQAVRLGAPARAGRQLLAGHPVERGRIEVDDVPFVAVELATQGVGSAGRCACAPMSTSG